MKKLKYIALGLFATVFGLSSCIEDNVDENALYTFVGETVTSYCQKQGSFNIFSQLIEETKTASLLACYGHFTCFAPTDSAFQVYFDEKEITYNDLEDDEKRQIVYNHVIKSARTEYTTDVFQEGSLPEPSMNDRFINISFSGFGEGSQKILVNQKVPILLKDVEVHNGVIHVVGKLIDPSNSYLSGLLAEQERFSLFSQALELTHLADSITKVQDLDYVRPVSDPGSAQVYPEARKYGYTIFAETDEVFRNNEEKSITTIDELVEYAASYYGSKDMDDYTSRENPLNKFMSYHILERQMSTSNFLYAGSATPLAYEDQKFEYYETMLQYRLIEIKSGSKINTLKDGSHVSIDDFQSNINGINGYIHTLNEVLVYNAEAMENDVLNKRIRFDCHAIPPQLTNNNIRWQWNSGEHLLTPDYCDDYFKFTKETKVLLTGSEGWTNYQADEMFITGWYDLTLRMHPVPPGTYEIRLGYKAENWRGVAQIFIDGEIAGIPVDLKILGSDPRVGWIADDDPTILDGGVENDKMMRNRGYMKAPSSICRGTDGFILRNNIEALRVIIGTFTFQDYAPHYFRARNVEDADRMFHFDYLEYVPVSYIDSEGID